MITGLIDFSSRKKRPEELLKLAKLFIRAPAGRQIGLYGAYPNVDELNKWRVQPDATVGCSIDQFIGSANERIVGVGLWFGAHRLIYDL
jgi:hypothetical protein